jgi:hypothetical protein
VTSAQAVAFASMLVAASAIFLLLFIGVPRLARLILVYRVEIIRDDCMDAILADRLPETPSVSRFLGLTDTLATLPYLFTLPRLLTMSRAMITAHAGPAPWPGYDDLSPGEQSVMIQLEHRFYSAYTSYLNWGSPASWVLRPVGLIIRRIRPSGAFATAEHAVQVVQAGLRSPAKPCR